MAGLLAALGLLAGCGPAPQQPERRAPAGSGPVWFEDYTSRAGVDFVHQAEASGRYLFSETMGSGGAFLDFDNDGRLDLYLIHNVNPTNRVTNRLYPQQADGRFQDVSAGSGLEGAGYGNGLAVGLKSSTF